MYSDFCVKNSNVNLTRRRRPGSRLILTIYQFYAKMCDGKDLLFLSKSSIHFSMCAIHSSFSVAVAAYTAKDLDAVRINQPLRYSKINIETYKEFTYKTYYYIVNILLI